MSARTRRPPVKLIDRPDEPRTSLQALCSPDRLRVQVLTYDSPTTVLVRSERICPRTALFRLSAPNSLPATRDGQRPLRAAPHAGARPVRPLGTLGENAARAWAGAGRSGMRVSSLIVKTMLINGNILVPRPPSGDRAQPPLSEPAAWEGGNNAGVEAGANGCGCRRAPDLASGPICAAAVEGSRRGGW